MYELPLVFETDVSLVTMCVDTDVPGYLILRPKIHADHLIEANEFSTELGPILSRLEHAIIRVTAATRVYVLRFSEAQPSVHFHLFPRTAGITDMYAKACNRTDGRIIGPELFEWARQKFHIGLPCEISQATLNAGVSIRESLMGPKI